MTSFTTKIDLLKILKNSDLEQFNQPPKCRDSFLKFFHTLTNTKKQPKGLLLAIKEYDLTFGKNRNFYLNLLPFLFNVARSFPPDDCIYALSRDGPTSQTLKKSSILWILIHCLFLNVKEEVHLGGGNLSMESIICSLNQVGVERLLCLLSYFYVVSLQPDLINGSLEFVRYSIRDNKNAIWNQRNSICLSSLSRYVHLQNGAMELYKDHIFVDFANEDIHIHKVIPSATQEEILFSSCPELFPAILFCPRMTDQDVFIIKGARRFSVYKGYLHTFQFVSPIIQPTPCDVLVMDASVQFDPNERNQFTNVGFARDLIKASIGFLGCVDIIGNNKIVTGHWGGGVFGGNKILKFLQQLIAAALNNCELTYCTFGDKVSYDIMQKILTTCSQLKHHTLGDLVSIIQTYDPTKTKVGFSDFILTALNSIS